LTTTWITSS